MAAAPDPWASIKAAYLSEGDYAAIARGRELGIRTLDVIPRIREWKAEAAEPAHVMPAEPSRSLVVASVAVAEVVADVETVQRAEQRLAGQLRGVLERELEEIQAMLSMTSSFVDVDHLETLKEKAIAGDPKPYNEYVASAVKARKLIGELVEKLARSINQSVQCERAVWGLDVTKDKGRDHDAVNWEAILDGLRRPLPPLLLPSKVIDFESRLRSMESRRAT